MTIESKVVLYATSSSWRWVAVILMEFQLYSFSSAAVCGNFAADQSADGWN